MTKRDHEDPHQHPTPRHDAVPRRLLYSTLRFIARHIKGFYTALLAFLTMGFAIGVGATALFAGIATATAAGVTRTVDHAILEWFAARRTPAADEVMLQITTLGNGVVLLMVVLVASVFLWETHHRWSVYLLLAGVIGGGIMNEVLKSLFGRPRPTIVESLYTVRSLSFPSGHAMVSLIVYGSVAYLVGRLEPTSKLRRTTWIIAFVLIALIGISRMYIGVHYPSDVFAGFLAGLAWLSFVASGITAVGFFSARRPEVRQEEQDLDAEAQRAVAGSA